MRTVVYLIISLFLAGVDQAVKYVIRRLPASFFPHQAGPLFIIMRVFNPGISFSIGERFPLAVTVIVTVFTGICIALLFTFERRSERLIWSIALGGMIGNMIDRLQAGVVTDYLVIRPVPLFVCNFADGCIFIGVVGLIFCLFFRRNN